MLLIQPKIVDAVEPILFVIS